MRKQILIIMLSLMWLSFAVASDLGPETATISGKDVIAHLKNVTQGQENIEGLIYGTKPCILTLKAGSGRSTGWNEISITTGSKSISVTLPDQAEVASLIGEVPPSEVYKQFDFNFGGYYSQIIIYVDGATTMVELGYVQPVKKSIYCVFIDKH